MAQKLEKCSKHITLLDPKSRFQGGHPLTLAVFTSEDPSDYLTCQNPKNNRMLSPKITNKNPGSISNKTLPPLQFPEEKADVIHKLKKNRLLPIRAYQRDGPPIVYKILDRPDLIS